MLVEALAAVAIMAIALASITQALAAAYRTAGTDDHMTKALLLLNNKLHEYYLTADNIVNEENACPAPFSRFTYKTSFTSGSEIQGQKPLQVAIHWFSGKNVNQVVAAILPTTDLSNVNKSP